MGLDGLADALNEEVGQLVGHVQPEAGSAQLHPGVDHAALAADEVLVIGVFLPNLGQGVEAPPASVAAGVLGAKVVPGAVAAVGVVVGPAHTVAALPIEVHTVGAGVAEHAVQNDADAVLAGLGAQGAELLVGAQQRVGAEVIGGVVPVIGVGLEDGVQVQVGDAQALQIGQLLADALKVAAEVVHVQIAAGLVGPEIRLAVFVLPVHPPGKGHGLVLHALTEPVGEDLVEHAALQAGGGDEVLLVHGELPGRAFHPGEVAAAVGAAVNAAEVGVQIKIIEVQPRLARLELDGEVVHLGGLVGEGHADVLAGLAVPPEHQMGVHIAVLFRHRQVQRDLLALRHGPEGRFILG